jgi:peptidoglycan/LPS O-acetylase OafA/YrhL
MVAVTVALLLGPQMIGFIVWMAGFGLALWWPRRRSTHFGKWRAVTYVVLTGLLFCLTLAAARERTPIIGDDLAVGLSFAALLPGLLRLQITLAPTVATLAKSFAGFSYSLYILHFPFLLFLRAVCLPLGRWQPSGAHVLLGLCLSLTPVLYAYGVARFTELKTTVVRARLQDFVSRRSSTQPQY